MPGAFSPATSTWTIVCFFVARPHRNQQVAHALLEGAVAYARRQGAEVVEGYPFDTGGVSSTHRGHSTLFKAAGFQADGKRVFRRLGRRSGRGLTRRCTRPDASVASRAQALYRAEGWKLDADFCVYTLPLPA